VIGLGADLCSITRMRVALDRTPRVAQRVFTNAERGFCERLADPSERFAARFAAKEAVLKAMGVGLGACAFRDIEVVSDAAGAPSIALRGAASELAAARGISRWHLSLSHDSDTAIAVVIAE
jgi:holo-[acyl-carrier protein] synthase